MDIFEQMKSKRSSFSNMDSRIYESIRKFPEMYASSTISELVQNTGFSQAALTRFAKRLGFDGCCKMAITLIKTIFKTVFFVTVFVEIFKESLFVISVRHLFHIFFIICFSCVSLPFITQFQ